MENDMSTHTLGPWRVEPTSITGHSLVVAGDDIRDRDSFSLQFTTPNARLIAAAPDLLAALKAAMPFLDNAGSPGGCDGSYPDCEHCAIIKQTRAAIAKAAPSPSSAGSQR